MTKKENAFAAAVPQFHDPSCCLNKSCCRCICCKRKHTVKRSALIRELDREFHAAAAEDYARCEKESSVLELIRNAVTRRNDHS